MAARIHVDPGINERRLRPIYDCLDNGNNKKALQEAEKLLKKQKDFQCAKVLKALALIRLGRQDEGLTSLREVHTDAPADDATLQAMTICYKELHKPELIADAYESALKKDPQNEELFSHLFMAYVRLGDYKKQQQTAMALYKLKPKNPYYFWVVMSLVMHSITGGETGDLGKTMLLPLAQRMVEKFVNEEKIEAEAEIQLYLIILEQQGKYEEALQVLDSSLGEKLCINAEFLHQKRVELLGKLERWPEVNSAFKKLITENPNQWSYYLEYFNSVSKLIETSWHPDQQTNIQLDPSPDFTFDMAMTFVSSFCKPHGDVPDDSLPRGPFLAQMELIRRIRLSGGVPTVCLEELLLSFFKRYGSKPSCFLDMSHAISVNSVSEEETISLLQSIRDTLIVEGHDKKLVLPKELKSMHRQLCYCQLHYYMGQCNKMSPQEKMDYVRDLVDRYQQSLQFGSDFIATDFHPYDNYIHLASYLLVDLWEETGDINTASQLMYLLEAALQKSPCNFHFKLLLIKVYNAVGAVKPSYALCESLDIKHIQQETLGYLITNPLVSMGHFSVASSTVGSAAWFFTTNFKDTVEYLIACYKFGSFTKVQEIVRFREKLKNSLQYTSVTLERMILDLMLETRNHEAIEFVITFMEIDPEKDKTAWKDLTDNRDVAIYRIWQNSRKKQLEDLKAQSFTDEVTWLKMRNMMVRAMAAAFYVSKQTTYRDSFQRNNITNGEKPQQMNQILQDLIVEIKEHVSTIDIQSLRQSLFPIEAPAPNRLKSYLEGDYISIITALLEVIVYLNNLADDCSGTEVKCPVLVKNSVVDSYQNVLQRVDTLGSQQGGLCHIFLVLQELTNCVETLCISAVLLSVAHMLLKTFKSSASKKNKKKKGSVVSTTFQHFTEMISGIEKVAEALHEKVQSFETSYIECQMNSLSLDKMNIVMEGKDEVVKSVAERIQSSYQQSIKELGELTQVKAKFIQTLKL